MKEGKERRPQWQQYGNDAAQLFRDFYFGKYPETISPKIVHEDRDRPYRFYNRTSFYAHLKKIVNRVKTFKQFGTGLDNAEFLRKVRLEHPPSAEEKGPVLRERDNNNNNNQFDSEDDEDESFNTEDAKDEKDIDLSTAFEVESFLGNLVFEDHRQEEEEIDMASVYTSNKKHDEAKQNNRKMKAVCEDSNFAFNNQLGRKSLVILPDGRLLGMYFLPSAFDGTFTVSTDGRKVVLKTQVPAVMTKAGAALGRIGMLPSDAWVVHLQSRFDDLVNTFLETPNLTARDPKKTYYEEVVFKLPFQVKPTFCSKDGGDDHMVHIGEGEDGSEWAFFFMVDANRKIQSPEPRMARDRSRRRADGSNQHPRTVMFSDNNTTVPPDVRRRVEPDQDQQFFSPRSEPTPMDTSHAAAAAARANSSFFSFSGTRASTNDDDSL